MTSVYNVKLTAPLASLPERQAFLARMREAGGTIAAAARAIPWISVFIEDPKLLIGLPGVVFAEQDSGCEECAPIASRTPAQRGGS